MKITYSKEKDYQLQKDRGISFKDFINKIMKLDILDDIKHPNITKYPNQRMFIIELQNYAYLVPYVEDENGIFLKTAFPSRKITKKYLR